MSGRGRVVAVRVTGQRGGTVAWRPCRRQLKRVLVRTGRLCPRT
jgi:hypothetical protein